MTVRFRTWGSVALATAVLLAGHAAAADTVKKVRQDVNGTSHED